MLQLNQDAMRAYSDLLRLDPPKTLPAKTSRDARLIARSELLALWRDQFWTVGMMLIAADAVRDYIHQKAGGRYAVIDFDSLHAVTKSRAVAALLLGLAGCYTTQVSGKHVWTDRDAQPHGVQIVFPRDLIIEALEDQVGYAEDAMALD